MHDKQKKHCFVTFGKRTICSTRHSKHALKASTEHPDTNHKMPVYTEYPPCGPDKRHTHEQDVYLVERCQLRNNIDFIKKCTAGYVMLYANKFSRSQVKSVLGFV